MITFAPGFAPLHRAGIQDLRLGHALSRLKKGREAHCERGGARPVCRQCLPRALENAHGRQWWHDEPAPQNGPLSLPQASCTPERA